MGRFLGLADKCLTAFVLLFNSFKHLRVGVETRFMRKTSVRILLLRSAAVLAAGALFSGLGAMSPAVAAKPKPADGAPTLIITNGPLPAGLRDKVYNTPKQTRGVDPVDIAGPRYFSEDEQTVVGKKIDELQRELFNLQGTVATLSESLATLESQGQGKAATYYAAVATISTQLQSGTTPGNPRLVKRLTEARELLETLAGDVTAFNDMAVQISSAASMSSFLLESARATYSLSGAIEEDHVRLAQMEDAVNNTIVIIDRLLNNVNDDITRTVSYLNSERENLRVLSLAVNAGDLLGKSLSNRPFSSARLASFSPDGAAPVPAVGAQPLMPLPATMPAMMDGGVPGGPRPLVKIRFDRTDVDYEQPLYNAVNEAMSRYPNARFELVAVNPVSGNAAATAIESTRARRNAERVLRTLTEMGLGLDRINLSYSASQQASTNEVHLYVR